MLKCEYCGEPIISEPITVSQGDISIDLCDTPCLEQFANDLYNGFISIDQWEKHEN